MRFLRTLLFCGLIIPVLFLTSCASPDSATGGGGGSGSGGGGGGGKGSIGPGTTATYIAFSNGSQIAVESINSNGTLTSILGSPYTAGTSPSAIVNTPDGKFFYVLNSNSVTTFAIAKDGTLTTLQSAVQTGNSPSGIVVDPQERFAAVANKTDGSVSVYAINASTGALVPFSNSPIFVGNNPVAVAATGNFIYAIAPNSIAVIAVDPINFTTSIPVGSPFSAGAVSASGLTAGSAGVQLYGLDTANNRVQNYTLNVSTGVPTFGASIASGTQPVALLQVLNGRFLYVANKGSNNVSGYAVDGTGGLTAIPGSPFTAGTGPSALGFDPVNNFLLVSNSGSSDLSVFNINTTTGALSPAATPSPLGGGVNSIAVGKP